MHGEEMVRNLGMENRGAVVPKDLVAVSIPKRFPSPPKSLSKLRLGLLSSHCPARSLPKPSGTMRPPPADAPEGDEFTVDWSTSNSAPYFSPTVNGLAVGPTIIRFYFGLPGCVIPIASVPMFGETPAMVFTMAGPVKEETKPFYVYLHNPQKLSASELYCLRSFSSVAEFFRNSHVEPWGQMCLSPVHGGEDATTKELIKCGYLYDELPKNYAGSIE
ncbi:hypothetical protein K438DRAFT_1782888 [Mycena galopus ATCC 62051]|nr:hypothetical protein K438DRAFT_1782888 [Mycena galopus ATCC 62051]